MFVNNCGAEWISILVVYTYIVINSVPVYFNNMVTFKWVLVHSSNSINFNVELIIDFNSKMLMHHLFYLINVSLLKSLHFICIISHILFAECIIKIHYLWIFFITPLTKHMTHQSSPVNKLSKRFINGHLNSVVFFYFTCLKR